MLSKGLRKGDKLGIVAPSSPYKEKYRDNFERATNLLESMRYNNIVAEVTFGNIFSLNNLAELGYEIKTWYQKDENIKRYILLKKLMK